MNRPRRFSRSRMRGHASIIFTLVIVLFLMMTATAFTLIMTRGIQVEHVWINTIQARFNAEAGCFRAEHGVAEQALPALKRMIAEAHRNASYNLKEPVLMGVGCPPIHAEYDLSTPELGPRQRAVVDIEIVLAGPPDQRSITGVPGTRNGTTIDDYTFWVRIHAVGSSNGIDVQAQDIAQLRVSTITGPTNSKFLQDLIANSSPHPASRESAERTAASAETVDYGFVLDGMEISPIVLGPPVPNPNFTPPGAWVGDPEIVSGPTLVGLPNGDSVYAFYLRGVPSGTIADGGATLLCPDDWRFGSTYDQLTDTASYGSPAHTLLRRWGTPRYAVAVVRAPSAATGTTNVAPNYARLVLPGGRIFNLELTGNEWVPQRTQLLYPGLGEFPVTGEPINPLSRTEITGRGAMVGGVPSPTGLPPSARGPEVGRVSANISVEGYAEDLHASGSLFPNIGGRLQTYGPLTLSLLEVVGKKNSLVLTWDSVNTANVANSIHTTFLPDDAPAPGGPPPPDPTCTTCPPPTMEVAFIAVMLIAGDVQEIKADLPRVGR